GVVLDDGPLDAPGEVQAPMAMTAVAARMTTRKQTVFMARVRRATPAGSAVQTGAVHDAGPEIELLDAGDGRRLQRFAGVVVDRPAEAALEQRQEPGAWAETTARFDDGWHLTAPLPDPWLVAVDGLTLELRPTASGQVGLYPEHALHWPWLRDRVAEQPGGS